MRFADVIGNASVAKALVSMADSGRVAHAMLMYENEGCGAMALALAYVQYLNCANPSGGDSCGECPSCRQMAKLIHPDVHFVFPVNKGPKASEEKPTSESYLSIFLQLIRNSSLCGQQFFLTPFVHAFLCTCIPPKNPLSAT